MAASRSTTYSPPAQRSLTSRVWSAARTAWRAYVKWYERRAAMRHLGSLDDRMLKDIGISRGEIQAVAYSGRPLRDDR